MRQGFFQHCAAKSNRFSINALSVCFDREPLDHEGIARIAATIRRTLSPRRVRVDMFAVARAQGTFRGEKPEFPAKNMPRGADPSGARSFDAVANPDSVTPFIASA